MGRGYGILLAWNGKRGTSLWLEWTHLAIARGQVGCSDRACLLQLDPINVLPIDPIERPVRWLDIGYWSQNLG